MLEVLVVEDDVSLARSIRRQLKSCGANAMLVTSLRDATEALEERERFSALILDLHLPDGSGSSLLHHAREVPTMVLTGLPTPEAMQRAASSGALFKRKPARREDLEAFVCWAAPTRVPRFVLERTLDDLEVDWGLTPRERELLYWVLCGSTYAEIEQRFEIATSTRKSHVRQILRKANRKVMKEVVDEVLKLLFAADGDQS